MGTPVVGGAASTFATVACVTVAFYVKITCPPWVEHRS
jgi:hypothetical protein